ncbi:MAG: CRTAC1 family protein, partial [Bacteroidota bacterium]
MRQPFYQISLLFISLFLGVTGYSQAIFSDVSSTAGINAVGSNHGLSVGDFDNDGDDDLFFPRNNNFDNILYRNNGDGTFTDVTSTAGLAYAGSSNNAVWGDLNKDGWLDLYVGNVFEPNLLYYNNGDGTFTEGGQTAGVDNDGKTKSLILVDINNDSWLDIYVANANEQNAFYLNNADGSFSDIVFPSNSKDELNAMAAIFFDFDNDNDQDLYLTHDGNEANILYENNGSGYFTDVSVSSGTNIAAQGMGVDAGDINKDGFLDLYITNLYDNTLLLNNGDGTFTNIAVSAGVNDYGMGWGTNFLDFDNDGHVDIYVSNDTYFSPYPNVLYKNNGDNTFTIVGENNIVSSTGGGYATACTDINDDGMIDLLIANAGMIEGNQLLRNLSPTNGNWLKVKAIGTVSNTSAIGARITVEANGEIFIDQVMAGNGYATQNSLTQHFGLGNAAMIDRVTVQFPSGI